MILAEGILDEIQHQAEVQGRKNYSGVEIDYRTILAMVKEIRDCRVVAKKSAEFAATAKESSEFNDRTMKAHYAAGDIEPKVGEDVFLFHEEVLYKGNRYLFLRRAAGDKCALENSVTAETVFADASDVRKMIDISSPRGNFKAGEHVVFAGNEFVFVRYSDEHRNGGCFLKPKEDVCNDREFHVLVSNVSRSPF